MVALSEYYPSIFLDELRKIAQSQTQVCVCVCARAQAHTQNKWTKFSSEAWYEL